MLYKKILFTYWLFCLHYSPICQSNTNQKPGIEIITSGGKVAEQLFIELLGGADAKVIFIPTAASSLRSESGVIWNPDKEENKKEYKEELLKRFKLNDIIILHTRDRKEADTKNFIIP